MIKRRTPSVGSEQLNELMLRYAQDNQISKVGQCLSRGANVDYKDGTLLLIAVYLGKAPLLKMVLAFKPKVGIQKAVDIAAQAGDDRLLRLLNDYCAREGL